MMGIAKILNQENTPSPYNAKAGKRGNDWSPDPIKDILQNEKYKGWNVWNMTEQIEHPVTKKIVKVFKPAHEHKRIYLEDLRIVSDELWEQAAMRRKSLSDAQTRRVLGGYNRASTQTYLYSGFLNCGHCGSKLTIQGKQGNGRYRCPSYRLRKGCVNKVSVPEELIAKEITELLAGQLLVPEHFEILVTKVFFELQSAFDQQLKSISHEEIPKLQDRHDKVCGAIESLIDSIEVSDSPGLSHRLQQREFEKSQLEKKMSLLKGKRKLKLTREDLDGIVRKNIAVLGDVLRTNVPLARLMLSQHLLKLSVYHDSKENPNYAFVIGEIDLFRGENATKNGVLLGDLGTQIPQQHSSSSESAFYFATGLDMTPEKDCPFLEPLQELLANNPELSLEAKKPGTWAKLLDSHLGDKRSAKLKLGSGAIGRCFRVHRELIEQHIHMVKVRNPSAGEGHLYQLTLYGNDNWGRVRPRCGGLAD
ncbi:MAG: hypothetical protein HIU87_15110 [Acidobacteria bacterium]|nr:hypothetical protein [Acidobacteriota bacterium]